MAAERQKRDETSFEDFDLTLLEELSFDNSYEELELETTTTSNVDTNPESFTKPSLPEESNAVVLPSPASKTDTPLEEKASTNPASNTTNIVEQENRDQRICPNEKEVII